MMLFIMKFISILYSYLKASIGLRLAAFLAGEKPKIIPIDDEKTKDKTKEI